jgi:hypothetical protein
MTLGHYFVTRASASRAHCAITMASRYHTGRPPRKKSQILQHLRQWNEREKSPPRNARPETIPTSEPRFSPPSPRPYFGDVRSKVALRKVQACLRQKAGVLFLGRVSWPERNIIFYRSSVIGYHSTLGFSRLGGEEIE